MRRYVCIYIDARICNKTKRKPKISNESIASDRQRALKLYDKFGVAARRDCGVKLHFQLTTSTVAAALWRRTEHTVRKL